MLGSKFSSVMSGDLWELAQPLLTLNLPIHEKGIFI